MYNLIVLSSFPDLDDQPLEISGGRFLEFSSKEVVSQLRSLSREAIASLKSWPCLIMKEGRGQEEAYMAQIVAIRTNASGLLLSISKQQSGRRIINDDLWKLRDRLDIGEFEFSRHHWAVKDQDLFQILAQGGIVLPPAITSRFENRPLPGPSRARLLEARDAMSIFSHTEIDDFLLEAGVSNLAAGIQSGSRRDRANAILRFILDNPGAKTAEDSLLSIFFIGATLQTDSDLMAVGKHPEQETRTERPAGGSSSASRGQTGRSPNRVFVVHGQDEEARRMVVDYLRRVGLEAVVLHEQPNMGRHLLTKFIEEAELATFAVVLMTGDDVGGQTPAVLNRRARQNVILELGYFLSHLGQPRVCALITPGLETPSDFDGIVYISMDEHGSWQRELERELRAAEMPLSS